jgi:hypothetical protein
VRRSAPAMTAGARVRAYGFLLGTSRALRAIAACASRATALAGAATATTHLAFVRGNHARGGCCEKGQSHDYNEYQFHNFNLEIEKVISSTPKARRAARIMKLLWAGARAEDASGWNRFCPKHKIQQTGRENQNFLSGSIQMSKRKQLDLRCNRGLWSFRIFHSGSYRFHNNKIFSP